MAESKSRTMRQALNAGNAFQISRAGWGDYFPPAAESPEEVLAYAKRLFNIEPGMVFKVYRILPQSTIGCTYLEDAGEITA